MSTVEAVGELKRHKEISVEPERIPKVICKEIVMRAPFKLLAQRCDC